MCKPNVYINTMTSNTTTEIPTTKTLDETHVLLPPPTTPTETAKKNSIKAVRFSEDKPTIITHNLKGYNTKEYFWQDSDYRRFLRMASLIAVEVRKLSVPRKPLDYEDVLTRTLLACEESAAATVAAAVEEAHNCDAGGVDDLQQTTDTDDPVEPMGNETVAHQGPRISPHLFIALSNWIQAGSSRRGLEKLIVPVVAKCRNEKRQASIKAVLDAQKQLMNDKSNPQCQHDYLDKENIIRRASEKVTR